MDFDFIKKLTFSIILLLTACLTSSQNVDVGSRSSSLNNCSVALSTVWASNQSGMTQFTKKGVGAFYSTRFMMRELSTKAVTIFIPLQKGTIGLKYQYFGYELFNNQLMGLYYAVKIYHQISIGVQMDLIMVGSANRKIQITPTCEIGLQAKLNDKVTLGLWTYNPIRVKTHKGEYLNTILKCGLSWTISNSLLYTIEIEKNTEIRPLIVRSGAEYNINKRYFFRIGVSNTNEYFSFGVGWIYGKVRVNLSSILNNYLGISMQSDIVFMF